MMRAHHARLAASKGFTLVETIIVMVVLGIASVAIASLSSNIFFGQAASKDIQVGTQLMQECAEQVLAVRRASGYSAITSSSFGTTLCGGMTAFGGYSIPSVSFTDPYTGSGCPTGGTCKLASISQGGMTALTLVLVSY